MNEIKTFRASSMQEALAIVRRELGMEAVILHTRQVRQRRLLPFFKAKEEVEITATLEARPTATVAAPPVVRAAAKAMTAPATESPVSEEPTTGVARAARLAAELERRHAEKSQLETSLRSMERFTGAKHPASDDVEVAWVGSPLAAPTPAEPATTRQAALRKPMPVAVSQPQVTAPPAADQATHLVAAMAAAASVPAPAVNDLALKLDALQQLVESLTRSTQMRGHDEIPAELFDIYTHLIDADIENDLARELVFRLRQNCSQEELHDTVASRAILSRLVEADIVCANPIRPTPGRRKVVALVGPTGVGKTTTIAKLAANFRLRDGVKMGLVTVDTYRIAAVEQLRTYADIIDLPMKVVTSPQEMRRALDELIGLDLVIIDTAGRSPRDEMKIQELKQMLSEAGVDEIHLVMSLTASLRNLRTTAEQFSPINPTAVVLTKLDEAAGMGSLLSLSKQLRLPVSYITTGQDVPDDIEPAHASRLARLVLGQDRLFE